MGNSPTMQERKGTICCGVGLGGPNDIKKDPCDFSHWIRVSYGSEKVAAGFAKHDCSLQTLAWDLCSVTYYCTHCHTLALHVRVQGNLWLQDMGHTTQQEKPPSLC